MDSRFASTPLRAARPLGSRAALAVGGLALLVACPEPKKPKFDPNVIATINGEVLGRAEFERELSRELQAMDGPPRTLEQIEPFKRSLLQTMVDRTLLLQAAKLVNVSVTAEEVDRQVLRASSDYPAEGFEDALSQGQLSMADLKRKTAALLTIEKLFQDHIYPRVAVTEEEIRRYYEEHASEFEQPEQVHAAQIVVKGMDEARRIQAQLRAGKKFADLARRYSLSADAKVGGDLGFFPRGVMPPAFDEVTFKLAPNQISDVVTSEYGYHLFKVLEKRPPQRPELADVRREIEEKLLAEKRLHAQTEYVKGLAAKADIQINEQALAAVAVKAGHGAKLDEP